MTLANYVAGISSGVVAAFLFSFLGVLVIYCDDNGMNPFDVLFYRGGIISAFLENSKIFPILETTKIEISS